MSNYTALYRKWRPKSFGEVRGQEHITTTLKHQVTTGRIGHAYLFCGTRGTGKTTVAKIFARAVNCEHPTEDGSPCNECPTCQAILSAASMDVVEIDAASNNGVDSIRQIRSEVQYSPSDGRYRVYIIDEVHMLSIGAFNALLKTLEEPPAYVIFILATTEVHKIPITILSRCQRYDFKRITNETIRLQLEDLTRSEGIEAESKALAYVAKAADGSMRDALSLLEQCISFYFGKALTYENVLDVLGAVDTQVFSDVLKSVLARQVPDCIRILDELSEKGRDLSQFVTDLIWYLRSLLLLQSGGDSTEALQMSADNMAALKQEAASLDTETLIRYIRILSELSNRMKYASAKRVLLEVTLIKMMMPAMEEDYESLKARVSDLERLLNQAVKDGRVVVTQAAGVQSQGSAQAQSIAAADSTNQTLRGGSGSVQAGQQTGAEVKVVEVSQAVYEDYETINRAWVEIVMRLSPLLAGYLRVSRFRYDMETNGFVIEVSNPLFFNWIKADETQNRKQIMDAVEKVCKKKLDFQFKCGKTSPAEDVKLVVGKHIPGIEMELEEEQE